METLVFRLFLLGMFLFGAIVGSFLNVLILRYNTGRTLLGRSGCLSCGRMLSFSELFPLFSYVYLRGKCRSCRSCISLQYPLVEALTGAVFAGVFYLHLPIDFSFYEFAIIVAELVVFSALISILVYDLRHKIIPNSFSAVFAFSALVSHAFRGESLWPFLLAGVLFFIPFYSLWKLSAGKLMGLGDGKLVLGLGFLLGVTSGFSAIVLAFWIGTLVSLVFMLLPRLNKLLSLGERTLTMKSEVPFAPFLVCGMFLVFFFGLDIFKISSLLVPIP